MKDFFERKDQFMGKKLLQYVKHIIVMQIV